MGIGEVMVGEGAVDDVELVSECARELADTTLKERAVVEAPRACRGVRDPGHAGGEIEADNLTLRYERCDPATSRPGPHPASSTRVGRSRACR